MVGFDIQLLWTREQKMSQAETVFLESSSTCSVFVSLCCEL
jgi:hypothetical protein